MLFSLKEKNDRDIPSKTGIDKYILDKGKKIELLPSLTLLIPNVEIISNVDIKTVRDSLYFLSLNKKAPTVMNIIIIKNPEFKNMGVTSLKNKSRWVKDDSRPLKENVKFNLWRL